MEMVSGNWKRGTAELGIKERRRRAEDREPRPEMEFLKGIFS
jgi:hypothetical protein